MRPCMRLAELAGRRVAVWGAGREGRAALAAIRQRVPALAPTLLCRPQDVAALTAAELPRGLRVVTAAPDAAMLTNFDVVIKSPGISAYRPEILAAARTGTRFSSGTALWFAEHPEARVIGVTGTKGKSTVSALIAHLLRACGERVALAGNIGLPLLELLDPQSPPGCWVIELSSFQTREAARLEVGVVNNLYEEHLDWHGSRERYVADKLALIAAARTLVLNGLQAELIERSAGHLDRRCFGTAKGWRIADGALWRGDRRRFELRRSPLPGLHNALNLCAALSAVEAIGGDIEVALTAIPEFRPLPHRLQTLGQRDGWTWIDDSIATTPQATQEALDSLRGRPVSVLVGGFDRGLDWASFAESVRARPPHAVLTMGASGPRIHDLLVEQGGGFELRHASGLAAAVQSARRVTPVGGVILLSPGAPSFDQFSDYAARGRAFAELGGFDPAAIGAIEGLGIR